VYSSVAEMHHVDAAPVPVRKNDAAPDPVSYAALIPTPFLGFI
jgi:hypothetical protein